MTLHTRIEVLDPVSVRDLFAECQRLIGADAKTRVEQSDGYIGNEPDQGLPAWCWIDYGMDGPIAPEFDEDTGEPYGSGLPYAVEVNFDTWYRYKVNGAGCEDLHAWLVDAVTAWLAERGADYRWQNEFTGEWFDSSAHVGVLGNPAVGALR